MNKTLKTKLCYYNKKCKKRRLKQHTKLHINIKIRYNNLKIKIKNYNYHMKGYIKVFYIYQYFNFKNWSNYWIKISKIN